jgi:hypothetical protein
MFPDQMNLNFVVTGNFLFISTDGTTALQSALKEGHQICWLCGTQEKLQWMQDHIAQHLVNEKLGFHEKLLQPVRHVHSESDRFFCHA